MFCVTKKISGRLTVNGGRLSPFIRHNGKGRPRDPLALTTSNEPRSTKLVMPRGRSFPRCLHPLPRCAVRLSELN
jgi:hypothetical protein